MKKKELFDRLWADYSAQNPSAKAIHNLFRNEGENFLNDHIAFRTFDDPRINIDVLSQKFIEAGYEEAGNYRFEEKKLFAKHYEIKSEPDAPKIFISQLITSEFSDFLRQKITEKLNEIPDHLYGSGDLIFAGVPWTKPSYEVYRKLMDESEYAAWLYVHGFRANHFTVFSNSMKKYERLEDLNDLLKKNGFVMNSSGGEIKGTPEQLLQQSSIMADIVKIEFKEGVFEVPACYYEFARRYPDKSGKLYNGFIAASADKIFESTNYRK
ncbi:MAG: succinyldiaminopimelate aminotransferase [Bacteroidetes bacterium GWF2_38_335]|nr:MAG: succinyldiaminopimelate aminotransferase [Bacteroidetes bacterium GWF2_38_335]OFY79016.1 MAG: succinyldiaminopimelate aminotransferase [Bacteroidetes bacterium RIFOXYA12_FULL_38_20]HBS86094.1 DUF1338 domain-containing protein [Bacteroidales bacterium]